MSIVYIRSHSSVRLDTCICMAESLHAYVWLSPFTVHLNRTLLIGYVCAKSLQLCLIFYNPMDFTLSGSLVHGILQSRILKWVAMPSSMKSS